MKNQIPIVVLLICVLQYCNQGIAGLPGQALYYLTRETWHLSAVAISLIGFVAIAPWYCKIFFGFIADRKGTIRIFMIINMILLLLVYLLIISVGLNLALLIATGLIINACIAFSDVLIDKVMVQCEQKYSLKGRLQSLQWTSLGVAGVVVAMCGAVIASAYPVDMAYRVAYMFAGIIPILILLYMLFWFKDEPAFVQTESITTTLKRAVGKLKNRKLLIGMLFIALFNFSPSFATPLMIIAREQLEASKIFMGYLGTSSTVLMVIGFFLYYKIFYSANLNRLMYNVVLLTVMINLFYLYLPNKFVLLGYNIAFGAVSGVLMMALLAFYITIVPKGMEGLFYSLIVSISNLSGGLGMVVGGFVFDHFGYATTVIVSSVCTFLCVFLIPSLQLKKVKI